MTLSGDEIDLVALICLLMAYTLSGVLLAGGRQYIASRLAIAGGALSAVIEIWGVTDASTWTPNEIREFNSSFQQIPSIRQFRS